MKENYLINVLGTQDIGGEKDSIELTTAGDYRFHSSKTVIQYREYDSENPKYSCLNTVEVEGDTVTVIKDFPGESRLVLQKGRRHQCHYSTMFGDLIVGVYADSFKNSLTEKGGELYVSYSLDFNGGLVSKNEIHIKVQEKEVK